MNESPPLPKNSALAIVSLVLGILGIVLLCVGPLFAIPAVVCGHIAYSCIKKSAGALTGQGLAMAGFITGYASIGLCVLLLPIAIPNFVRARHTAQKNFCINNLRQIEAAKQQWALENKKMKNDTPTEQDVSSYLKGGLGSLHCPAGGTYTIDKVGEPPACSVPEHHWLNALDAH